MRYSCRLQAVGIQKKSSSHPTRISIISKPDICLPYIKHPSPCTTLTKPKLRTVEQQCKSALKPQLLHGSGLYVHGLFIVKLSTGVEHLLHIFQQSPLNLWGILHITHCGMKPTPCRRLLVPEALGIGILRRNSTARVSSNQSNSLG